MLKKLTYVLHLIYFNGILTTVIIYFLTETPTLRLIVKII